MVAVNFVVANDITNANTMAVADGIVGRGIVRRHQHQQTDSFDTHARTHTQTHAHTHREYLPPPLFLRNHMRVSRSTSKVVSIPIGAMTESPIMYGPNSVGASSNELDSSVSFHPRTDPTYVRS